MLFPYERGTHVGDTDYGQRFHAARTRDALCPRSMVEEISQGGSRRMVVFIEHGTPLLRSTLSPEPLNLKPGTLKPETSNPNPVPALRGSGGLSLSGGERAMMLGGGGCLTRSFLAPPLASTFPSSSPPIPHLLPPTPYGTKPSPMHPNPEP